MDCYDQTPSLGCVQGFVTTSSGAPAVNICVGSGTPGGCAWRTDSQGFYHTNTGTSAGVFCASACDFFFNQDPATKTSISFPRGAIFLLDKQLP